MKAMILEAPGQLLQCRDVPDPVPGPGEVLVKVAACGVCRTDLHVVDGDLTEPRLPIIPGHEIVGRVEATGAGVLQFARGDRVGIPWLGHTCGSCFFCRTEQENLCDSPLFTGYQINGGYADYTVAEAAYCFPLPESYADAAAAPLLCAGLIGHRALRMTGDAKALGIYGFGAAAHIVAQVAQFEQRSVYAFTRPGRFQGSDVRPQSRLRVGRRLRRASRHHHGCGNHLRARRRPGTPGAGSGPQRRHRRPRRDSHERDSGDALQVAVGRAHRTVGRQSHATGRAGVPGNCRSHADQDRDRAVCPSDANTALRHLREGQLTGAAVLVPEHST